MSTIRLPGALQPLAGGVDEIEVQAATVEAALAILVERYPRLRRHLFDERGALRGYVNVYLNEEDVRFLADRPAHLQSEDVITIVPSVAGG
jgi:adenylyltransferase/sulfurtransferase